MKSNSEKWLRNPICTASSRQNNKFVEEQQKKKKESSFSLPRVAHYGKVNILEKTTGGRPAWGFSWCLPW